MFELNKIYNEDCLTFMKQVPDKYFDFVLTSPPYNMRTRVRNGQYTIREKSEHFSKKYKHFGDDMHPADFFDFHIKAIREMARISAIVAYNFQIVTGSKEAFFKIIGEMASDIKDIIVWDKGNGPPSMHENVLNASYELILIIESDKKRGRMITNSNFGRGELSNVWRIGRGAEHIDTHRAVMPYKLASELVRNFAKPKGIVFDPFMGSGTTAVACESLGLQWCGCELEPDYVAIANKRLEKVQGSLF